MNFYLQHYESIYKIIDSIYLQNYRYLLIKLSVFIHLDINYITIMFSISIFVSLDTYM